MLVLFICILIQVEGLAKHLRCVGIDAAVPYSRKPETRCCKKRSRRLFLFDKVGSMNVVLCPGS